jgi:uncharacterized protein with PIN domain
MEPILKATFRFYEELNDFLPEEIRKTSFQAEFTGKRSIKDMIEAMGVPHTEIDLILVNGSSVDFNYIVQEGDRVSVYPIFESLNIENVTRLREMPLRKTSFIADVDLGDIVKYMRCLGFDVYFNTSLTPREIIEISKQDTRIILTKSTKLLKFKNVTHGMYIRPGTTEDQVKRIIDNLDIRDQARPFSRCLLCNSLLTDIPKERVWDRIPPKTREWCDQYTYCQSCDRLYWKGTHFVRMKKRIDRILGRHAPQEPD